MSITLYHNPHGQLCWRAPDGTEHRGLVPVRAFPIQAPQEGISLVGPDGKEVLWVAHLNELPPATRQVLEASLAEREFIPVIERIDALNALVQIEAVVSHGDGTPPQAVEDARNIVVEAHSSADAPQGAGSQTVAFSHYNHVSAQLPLEPKTGALVPGGG